MIEQNISEDFFCRSPLFLRFIAITSDLRLKCAEISQKHTNMC